MYFKNPWFSGQFQDYGVLNTVPKVCSYPSFKAEGRLHPNQLPILRVYHMRCRLNSRTNSRLFQLNVNEAPTELFGPPSVLLGLRNGNYDCWKIGF